MNKPHPESFDLYNAHCLAQASLEAYYPDKGYFYPSMLPGAVRSMVRDDKFDTQVLIWITLTDIIIAFRGTQDRKNVTTDLDCLQVQPAWLKHRPADAKIHKGFEIALGSVWERLLAALPTNWPERRVWLTGHSLGGALAILAAQRLYEAGEGNGSSKIAAYTFGQPRVGNKAFCRMFDLDLGRNVWRVTHPNDGVPMVPFMMGAYRDLALHALLQADKIILEPGLFTEARHLAMSLLHDIRQGHPFSVVYEHSCALYAGDIESRMKRSFISRK